MGGTGLRRMHRSGEVADVNLRARVTVGVGWTGGAHWFGVVAATVTTAVVARFLVPEDFAIVAAAGALAGVLGALQESGIAAAVVQHAGDGTRAATTGLLLNLAGATAGLLVCLALTPWLAAFFQIDRPAALAVAFTPLWLRAWMNVPLARLQKALDFRRCALVELAQIVTYPALTIPLAVTGAGAWALVVGQAAAAAAGAIAAWILSAWRPRLRDFDWETGRALLRFGRPLVWSNLLGMTNDRIDNWVVGRVLGPAALGLYVMAFRLATLPRTGFTFVVSRVLFPALTTLRGDEQRMRDVFLRALHWVATCAMPASVGLAVLAPEIVAVALGPGWAGVVPAVRVLAGFALVGSLAATTGDVFKATGRSVLIFRIGLVHSAVLWTGLALLAPRGIAWAGFAVSLAATVSGATAFGCAILALGVRPGMLARVLATPLGATVAMTAVLLGARAVPVAPGAVRLVGLTLVAIAAYVGSHALLAPGDVREVGGALAAVRERRDAHARALAAG